MYTWQLASNVDTEGWGGVVSVMADGDIGSQLASLRLWKIHLLLLWPYHQKSTAKEVSESWGNYLTWHSNVVCCRCFEVNNCPGLYWAGNAICSQAFLDKIERKVEEEEKQEILLSTRTIFNEVETALEDELEPVYKVPRRFKSFTQELSRKSTPLGFSKKCLTAIASCCKPGSTILPMR